MTKCIKRIRDLFEYALYKFTLYLLTYLLTRVDQSKTAQARITKSSPSAAWKTIVSGTLKLFHKFERGHPERGR